MPTDNPKKLETPSTDPTAPVDGAGSGGSPPEDNGEGPLPSGPVNPERLEDLVGRGSRHRSGGETGEAGRGARSRGRLNLPRSGLAEDVLAALGAEDGEAGQTPAPPTGPDRIYDLADSLARSNGERGRERKEEALETWVTFVLANESFGLPVSHVQEILRVTGITRVPHAPNPVRGVANMRGRVLPVVDLRLRLGIPSKEIDGASRILVVESRGRLIGLLVDAVQQVIRLAASGIQPPPPDVMTTQSDYILGVYHLQESLVILLVVDRVLHLTEALSSQS